MGLYRAFVQPAPTPVLLPNGGQVTNIPLSTTTPAAVIMARSDGRRRGFFIENSGSVPMVFALGATVSVGARTARLEAGDVYEDTNPSEVQEMLT
jgi:hypothetical protein